MPTIALVTSSIMCPRKSSLYKPSSEFQDLSEPSLSKSFGGDISAIQPVNTKVVLKDTGKKTNLA